MSESIVGSERLRAADSGPLGAQDSKPLRAHVAPIALLFAAVLVRWWRVLPGIGAWHFEDGDFVDQFYAFARFEVAELAAGRLPLWNPHAYAGSPFWSDVQAAVAYPPSLAVALGAAWTSGRLPIRALELEAVAHVAIAALGTYLFAHYLLRRRGPALLAALAFGLGGWVNGYPMLQLAVLEAAAWLPWALWGVARTIDRPRDWPLAAVPLGLCVLAGHPQTALYVAYTTAAWAIWLLARSRGAFDAVGGGIGVGVGKPMGIGGDRDGTGDEKADGPRNRVGVGGARDGATTRTGRSFARALRSSAQLTPARLFPPARLTPALRTRLTALTAAAVGALGLSAAGWLPAAAFLGRSNRASLGYDALAHGFPNSELLGLVLPGITKWAPLFVGYVPLGLAGYAAWRVLFATGEAPRDEPAQVGFRLRSEPFWLGLFVIALLLSLGRNGMLFDLAYLLAPGFDLFRGQERAALLVSFALAMLAGFGAKSALEWVAGRTSKDENGPAGAALVLAALLVLTVIDLVQVGGTTNLALASADELRRAPVQMMLAETAAVGRVHDNADRGERRWPPNAGMIHGYESLDGASPLRLNAYEDVLAALAPDERRLWELLAVGHVVAARDSLPGASRVMDSADGDGLFRLDAPWPRAWRVSAAERIDDGLAAARLADPAWDPMSVVLLANKQGSGHADRAVASAELGPHPAGGAATSFTRPAPGVVTVATDGPAPGWIVVSEIHDPGWRAELDGARTPVLRADLGLLAVAVPAGAHTLVLRYRPRAVPLGIALSLLFALALAAAAWSARRHRGEDRGGSANRSTGGDDAEDSRWHRVEHGVEHRDDPAVERQTFARHREGMTSSSALAVRPNILGGGLARSVTLCLAFGLALGAAGCRPERDGASTDGTPAATAEGLRAESPYPGATPPSSRGERGFEQAAATASAAVAGDSLGTRDGNAYPGRVRSTRTPSPFLGALLPHVLVHPVPAPATILARSAAGATRSAAPVARPSSPATAATANAVSTRAANPTPFPTGPCTGIVGREGQALVLDGKPFTFFGTNVHYLLAPEFPESRMEEVVAHLGQQGATVLRVWFQPEHDPERFARLLDIGRRHGVRFLVTLEDNVFHGRDWFGASDDEDNYRPHLERTVRRHKDRPEVLLWELINEPNCAGNYDQGCLDTIKGWLRGRAREVKAIDACHLVSTGMIGVGNYERDLTMYRRTHRTEEIDVLSMHKRVDERRDQELEVASELDLPLILGEVYDQAYDKSCTPLDGGSVRDRRAERIADNLRDALADGVDGYMLWVHSEGGIEQPDGSTRYFCSIYGYERDDPLWRYFADTPGLLPPVPWRAVP